MKSILILIILINSFSFAQEDRSQKKSLRIIDFYEIYVDQELLYEYTTKKRYSGFIHTTKRKGWLIQEDYVENGIIHYTNMFYKGELKVIHSKYVYNKDNPYVLREILYYNKKGDITSIVYYDYDGRKILEEIFEEKELVYSCEYDGKKRHGREFCISKKCDTTFVFYKKGKRIKN